MSTYTRDTIATIQEYMNERNMLDVIQAVKLKNPMYSRIRSTSKKEDFYGKYARLTVQTLSPMNAGPRPEGTDVMLPGTDEFKNLLIYQMQYMASMGFTKEESEEAVKSNGAANGNLIELKMNNCKKNMNWTMNGVYSGDGTGRLARVSAWTDGTLLVTVDNTKANFGWDKCAYIRNGMVVDIYTVPDIAGTDAWTLKCDGVTVSSVDKDAGTFVVSGHSVDPADGDFVFIHNSVTLTAAVKFSAWNNMNGLMSIVDAAGSVGNEFNDGSSNDYNGSYQGATFQNLTRSSYDFLNAVIWRADTWAGGTAGTETTCDTTVIDDAVTRIDEEGEGGGSITAAYCNPKTRNWWARTAFAANNGFVNVDSGKLVPGMYIESFRTSTGKVLPVIPMNTLPDGTIYFVDEKDLILFESLPIGWERMNGQILFPAPGERNLTFEAWLRTKGQLGATRCDNCLRLEDIDTDE